MRRFWGGRAASSGGRSSFRGGTSLFGGGSASFLGRARRFPLADCIILGGSAPCSGDFWGSGVAFLPRLAALATTHRPRVPPRAAAPAAPAGARGPAALSHPGSAGASCRRSLFGCLPAAGKKNHGGSSFPTGFGFSLLDFARTLWGRCTLPAPAAFHAAPHRGFAPPAPFLRPAEFRHQISFRVECKELSSYTLSWIWARYLKISAGRGEV